MKKYILITLALVGYIAKANAQYIEAAKTVLNFAKKSKEEMIAEELREMNKKLEIANKESILNKLSNIEQQYYLSAAEDFLFKVNDYIKKGKEINAVYDREEAVLLKMKELERIYSTSFSGAERKDLKVTTGNVLKQTGDLVDLASSIISDGNFRMTSEERRNYLKEILTDISRVEGILDEQIYTAKMFLFYKAREKEDKKAKENFEKELERKQQILNNM